MDKKTILLTGVTGYVGGCLLKVIEQRKGGVRCVVRESLHLQERHDPRTQVSYGGIMQEYLTLYPQEEFCRIGQVCILVIV